MSAVARVVQINSHDPHLSCKAGCWQLIRGKGAEEVHSWPILVVQVKIECKCLIHLLQGELETCQSIQHSSDWRRHFLRRQRQGESGRSNHHQKGSIRNRTCQVHVSSITVLQCKAQQSRLRANCFWFCGHEDRDLLIFNHKRCLSRQLQKDPLELFTEIGLCTIRIKH